MVRTISPFSLLSIHPPNALPSAGRCLRPLPAPHSGLAANDFKESPKGAVWLYDLANGVLYTQAAGHWEMPVAERFKKARFEGAVL